MAYASVNPATGEVLRTFTYHSDAELQGALSAAHSLYKSDWCKGPRAPRLEVLSRLAARTEDELEFLAKMLVKEMGKRILDARAEVKLAADIIAFYARAETFLAPGKMQTSRGDAWVEYRPLGVVVAVEPWNYPLYQLVQVAGPNIAVGNPVLPKHASIVPHAMDAKLDGNRALRRSERKSTEVVFSLFPGTVCVHSISPEETAFAKSDLVPYAIGLVCLLALFLLA